LELKFVWALLQARKKHKSKNPVYVFNKKQEQALDNLWGALDQLEDDDEHWEFAVQALNSLFDEVYFPEAYKTKNSDFDMPSSAFLAMQCVAADGSYLNIHHVPPIIAKLQYSFRLRATHRILSFREAISSDDDFFE
jgi:hypothetical protein